jgi:hypothetical protein
MKTRTAVAAVAAAAPAAASGQTTQLKLTQRVATRGTRVIGR